MIFQRSAPLTSISRACVSLCFARELLLRQVLIRPVDGSAYRRMFVLYSSSVTIIIPFPTPPSALSAELSFAVDRMMGRRLPLANRLFPTSSNRGDSRPFTWKSSRTLSATRDGRERPLSAAGGSEAIPDGVSSSSYRWVDASARVAVVAGQ